MAPSLSHRQLMKHSLYLSSVLLYCKPSKGLNWDKQSIFLDKLTHAMFQSGGVKMLDGKLGPYSQHLFF
jgi:hypothetical protein